MCRWRTLEAARAEAEARSAAHAAGEEVLRMQLKALQQEAAALQQELMRAGAAAGAAAAASEAGELYPAAAALTSVAVGGAPMQLPQALRELGQWQRRAQQAELAVHEVGGPGSAAMPWPRCCGLADSRAPGAPVRAVGCTHTQS